MQCVAHYEVTAEGSVYEDKRWLELKHPNGLFRARVRNIPRKDYSSPFKLTLHLYFDAPSLDEGKDLAERRLADCLNMMVLTTGCAFQRHRIRQLVDASSQDAMRTLFYWSDPVEYDDPHSILDEKLMETGARLLSYEIPSFLQRALRWYRLGVNARIPDDQFQCFWFALELVATAQNAEKVHDLCQTCHQPLFCKTCNEHPMHLPFPVQQIEMLVKAVDKNFSEEKFKLLLKGRHALMHGGTLRELEKKLPEPHESIVDELGKIVFLAVINQFPRELFYNNMAFANPSTYLHRKLTGIVKMQTVVPRGQDGELELEFAGFQATFAPDGPPQSARPAGMVIPLELHSRLLRLAGTKGEQREMLNRVAQKVAHRNDAVVVCVVLATDLEAITKAAHGGEQGDWQDLMREVLACQREDVWKQASAPDQGAG